MPDPPSGIPVFLPPSGPNPGAAPWQAELESWSEELQEAWDERSALREFDGELDRATAERRALEMIAGRREPALWDHEMRTALRRAGFPEVAPAELDARALVPASDEVGVAQPWTCQDPFCLHKGRWWLSVLGVVNCWNCVPPTFPRLVVAEGTAEEAPFVEPDRPHQAVAPHRSPRPILMHPCPETESAAPVEPLSFPC